MAIIRKALKSSNEFNATLKASKNQEVFSSGTAFTYAGMGNTIKSPADLKSREVVAVLRGNADTYLLGVMQDKDGNASDKYTDIAPWPMFLTPGDKEGKNRHWVINGGVDLQMRASKLPESYLADESKVNIHLNRNPARDENGDYTCSNNRVNGFENGSDNIVSEKMGGKDAAKKSFVTQLYNLVMDDLKNGTGIVRTEYHKEVVGEGKNAETKYVAYSRDQVDEDGRPLKVLLSQKDIDKYEEKVNQLFDARATNDDVETKKLQNELMAFPRPTIQLYVPLKGDLVLGVNTFAKSAKAEYAKYRNDPNHLVDDAAAKTQTGGNPSKYTMLRPQTMTFGDPLTDEEIDLQNKYAFLSHEDRLLVSGVESTKATETATEAPKPAGRGRGRGKAVETTEAIEGFNMPDVREQDGADGDGIEA